MTQPAITEHKASFAYLLRSNEQAAAVAQRLGAPAASVQPLEGAVIELPVGVEGEQVTEQQWQSLEQAVRARFPNANTIEATVSNGISTLRVLTDEETFDVVARGGKVFVITFDGFGGVDDLQGQDIAAAFTRAYDAYRVLLKVRRL